MCTQNHEAQQACRWEGVVEEIEGEVGKADVCIDISRRLVVGFLENHFVRVLRNFNIT